MSDQDTNELENEMDDDIIVEEISSDDSSEEIPETDDSSEDQFEKSSKSTQKRINNLTKRMREAERQTAAALDYAKGVQHNSDQLQSRMSSVDQNYVSEYANRVGVQTQQAEEDLARAMEMNDSSAAVNAQRRLSQLAIQQDKADQARYQQDNQAQQQVQQQQVQQQQVQQQQLTPDMKAQKWALKNKWFGKDDAKTHAAFGIHKTLIEDEGYDPTSNEYYNELDKRITGRFNDNREHVIELNTGNRPTQTVAGTSRSTSKRKTTRVRLTPSQIHIAKQLGVSVEDYAKQVRKLEKQNG